MPKAQIDKPEGAMESQCQGQVCVTPYGVLVKAPENQRYACRDKLMAAFRARFGDSPDPGHVAKVVADAYMHWHYREWDWICLVFTASADRKRKDEIHALIQEAVSCV